MATRGGATRRGWGGLLAGVLVVALAVWLALAGGGGAPGAAEQEGTSSQSSGTTGPSGLPTVPVEELPPEGRETLDLVDAGGPFPYRQDGATFYNREGLLPQQRRGYYREYTVETPGSDDRGARRVVVGEGGDRYWTEDHYRSFEEIDEP